MAQRFLHLLALLFIMLLSLSLVPHRAYGGAATGKILGSVVDPGGAPLPGAKITLTNDATNEARTDTSDADGNFSFPFTATGNYSVRVEAAGFEGYVQHGIILEVDQSVSIRASLTVGSIAETVQVSSTAQGVNLVDATVSHVVDEQRIVDLPLNGRDPLQLQNIMPGVTYDTNNVSHGQGQHEGIVVNGNRPGSNYYLLDGVDMTDAYLSTAPVFPAPDALQEFDIQTSNFTAQYGRSSGGLVNTVSRAGTNNFHGGAFEFFRNTVLDAHNYFDTPGQDKPSFKLNQFGGFLGGPIQKDKMFFFGYYQGTRQRKDETLTIGQVLTQAQRPDLNGGGSNVSGLVGANGGPVIDPLTQLPFPNNFIPANRIDPTALNLIKALVPLPNNASGGYTFISPVANNEDDLNENQYLGRIDRSFGPHDTAFGRYFFNQDESNGIGGGNLPGRPHLKYFRNQNVALAYTHTFNPNFINNAVFGFTRVAHHRGPTESVGWEAYGGPATGSAPGVLSDLFTSVNGSISASGDGAFVQNRQTWQYSDSAVIIKDNHTMTYGVDYRREASNRVEDYQTDPSFNFNGQYSGNALVDLMLGLPNNFNQQTEVFSRLRHNAVDVYAQDNWKVNRSVTVDAGIRWEPFLPPVDNLNDQLCFDESLTSRSSYYPTAPNGLTFPGSPVGSNLGGGDAGCPRAGIPNRYKNFAPRIGFNVDPFRNGKTSIRAGYGIFYDQARLIAWNRFSTAQPFDSNSTVTGVANLAPSLSGNNVFTNNGLVNPFPFVIPRTAAQRAAFVWPTNAAETVFAPNFNEGYTQQFNLSVQQQLARTYTLTLSYIGNKGTHLFMSREYNYAPLSSFVRNPPPDPITGQIPDPITYNNSNAVLLARRRLSSLSQCPLAAGSIATGPCYGATEMLEPTAYSNFNSVQVELNHRFSQGFSVLASYVYAKYLDIFSYTAEGGNGPRDGDNFALDYGPSDNDVRNRFAASYIYQLPSLKGAHGLVGGVANGWQNQGIITVQTGTPYSINSSVDTSAQGIGRNFADPVPGQSFSPAHRGVQSYFNTAAFTNAAAGTIGATGRNLLYGPSLVNVDFSLFKEFKVREYGRIQFRGEFFNLFNHPNFANPDNTVGDGTFGQILSARDPRITQFALKYLF
ncbi:TonB-dependent receptor [Acidipila sp. EB88]|uniref:TonB-dependent receptor n=1 Tax=Acidipila sp. EB88 TaxID=2305226 RepID=UPI000F5F00C1|nr:carboxypeptidase regulatory-like domain-containing protein [Acidipila sp. EB88]RRA49147.1 TonB-dependent receptor [Acidipila sp. EB88]